MAKKSKHLPDVICLSDDEDNEKILHSAVTPTKQPESPLSVVNKDEVHSSNWTIDDKDVIRIPQLPSKYSDIFKKPFEIRCTAIHFGIAEFNVELDIVYMGTNEFQMKLANTFMNNINMKLSYSDILKFYFSFQSEKPSAIIHVRNEFALLFNKYIQTSDEHGKGFDPTSSDEKRRHIIFHLKSLTPDMEKIHTSTIYHLLKKKCPKADIRCLSASRLHELYELARFAKKSEPIPKIMPFFLKPEDLMAKTVGLNNKKIRFDLSPEDLHCLNEGEFLNDNIIDFYLQYIYYEKLSDDDRKNTYLFNSFFYTRLTQKNKSDSNDNISAAERRYNRVKRWLRDVDIFAKEHLIVPINQNAHWYIVLIENPNNVPTEGDLISDDDDDDDDRIKSKKKRRSSRIIHQPERYTASPKSKVLPFEILDDADEVPSDDDIPLKINIELLVNSKTELKSPSIIIFDSFRLASKTRVAATLREFLQLEFDHKRNLSAGSLNRKLYNIDTIPTIDAAVPQQRNYSDCGLYILQYIESFFSYRVLKATGQLSTFTDKCEKNLEGSTKRQEILHVIDEHVIAKDE